MTALTSVVIGSIVTYIYMAYVNPGFTDIIYQAQAAKMEAKGMSSAQIEGARRFMSPGISTIFQMVFGAVFATIVALIVAIFFRKKPVSYATEDAVPPVV